jgi:hypothetical protein
MPVAPEFRPKPTMLPVTVCPEKYDTVAILAQCLIPYCYSRLQRRCPFFSPHLSNSTIRVVKLNGILPKGVKIGGFTSGR